MTNRWIRRCRLGDKLKLIRGVLGLAGLFAVLVKDVEGRELLTLKDLGKIKIPVIKCALYCVLAHTSPTDRNILRRAERQVVKFCNRTTMISEADKDHLELLIEDLQTLRMELADVQLA